MASAKNGSVKKPVLFGSEVRKAALNLSTFWKATTSAWVDMLVVVEVAVSFVVDRS